MENDEYINAYRFLMIEKKQMHTFDFLRYEKITSNAFERTKTWRSTMDYPAYESKPVTRCISDTVCYGCTKCRRQC